jgi:hypothetical protein
MNSQRVLLILTAIVLFATAATAVAVERSLDRTMLERLAALAPAQDLVLEGFPVGPTQVAGVRFERVDVYATGSRIYAETAHGRVELPRSRQIFLRGYSADGATRVALALNPDLSVAHGTGTGPEGSFVLHVVAGSAGPAIRASKLESDLPSGFKLDFRCGNESEKLDLSALGGATDQLQAAVAAQTATATAAHSLRFAIVAVDTDSLFMSRLFSNNTTSAINWIAGMFNAMNLMYERDLLVQLKIGTTILRTNPATDPYASFTPNATTSELDVFANYWKTKESGDTRAFATLLSGAIASTSNSCSASGIAWLDQYCQKGFSSGANTVGSYSLTQVCTSINIDPNGTFDARIVGHEIGHNFGADHTHCTNVSTGAYPVATNTIDTCYSGESGCYSGATSCPAAGAGTIMSYCNMTSASKCHSGTQNLLQFHPTHITQIDGLIAGSGSCLNSTDDIFFSQFE